MSASSVCSLSIKVDMSIVSIALDGITGCCDPRLASEVIAANVMNVTKMQKNSIPTAVAREILRNFFICLLLIFHSEMP